jgi:hypothetical protein
VPALLYGLFACYAVTGKCDLRIDSQGRDITVFASLEDCQQFGTSAARQSPDKQGKWPVDASHYYQCFGMTPVSMAAPVSPAAPTPPSDATEPVYKTTSEALQRDYQADPQGLRQKIGGALIEVSGTVENASIAEGTALQLSGDSWDVTAWLNQDGITAARAIKRNQHVTLRCARIGTLVAGSGRHPAVVEVRDCKPVSPDK